MNAKKEKLSEDERKTFFRDGVKNSWTWKFLEKVEILERSAESADELLIFVREIASDKRGLLAVRKKNILR